MKIVIFHQPFPMGNFHISNAIAEHLTSRGHEVYLLEQLNGANVDTTEYVNAIKSVDPDVLYFEMLDSVTFNVVSKFNCKKVLTVSSKGVLDDAYNIIQYKNIWYTHILTNSVSVYNLLQKNNIPSEHFKYYWNPNKHEILFDYNYDCVFLGQGYHRLTMPECKLEKDIFFNFQSGYDSNYAIYGLGWPNVYTYKGILPSGHNHSLYSKSKSAVSIIEPDQRIYGMINNRYSEIAGAECPIITYPYNDIDWFGLQPYLNFVESYEDFKSMIKQCVAKEDSILKKVEYAKNFFEQQKIEFLEKFTYIIEND